MRYFLFSWEPFGAYLLYSMGSRWRLPIQFPDNRFSDIPWDKLYIQVLFIKGDSIGAISHGISMGWDGRLPPDLSISLGCYFCYENRTPHLSFWTGSLRWNLAIAMLITGKSGEHKTSHCLHMIWQND